METPLSPLQDISVDRPATTSILVVPKGPDWVSRQTHAELLSLKGWKISRRELVSLLKQWRLVKRFLLGVTLLSTMLVILAFDHYSTLEWRIFAAILLVAGIIGTIAYLVISSRIKKAFSKSFLEDEDSDVPKVLHQPVRVSVQNVVSWISRQTNEEVLSVDGWSEEDIEVLLPLLSRKRIVQICMHVFGLLFIAVLWIPFFWPNPNNNRDENDEEDEPQEQSRATFILLFLTQMVVVVMYGVFVCWSIQLSSRVETLFSIRFIKKRSGQSINPPSQEV